MSELTQYAIVYVDDEAMALKYFEKGFSQTFKVFTASNATDGWELIQRHHQDIGVLMTDQRMPGQTGVELLEKVRRQYPQIIRILVTAYSDIDSAISGVNEGAIYKYISKPWDVADLRITLLRALEFFAVLKERDQLLGEKLSVLQRLILGDKTKNLAVLSAGLNVYYRNSVLAASQFAAAIPEPPPAQTHADARRGPAVRALENSIAKASGFTFHIASALLDLAHSPPSFQTKPDSLKEQLQGLIASIATHPTQLEISDPPPGILYHEKQFPKLFLLLLGNLAAVSDPKTSLSVKVLETTDEQQRPAVRFDFSDGAPPWAFPQHCKFFSPFCPQPAEPHLGLNLAVCFFLAYHHGGWIKIPGAEGPKIILQLPQDPAAVQPRPMEPFQLDELFRFEAKNLNPFFTN